MSKHVMIEKFPLAADGRKRRNEKSKCFSLSKNKVLMLDGLDIVKVSWLEAAIGTPLPPTLNIRKDSLTYRREVFAPSPLKTKLKL